MTPRDLGVELCIKVMNQRVLSQSDIARGDEIQNGIMAMVERLEAADRVVEEGKKIALGEWMKDHQHIAPFDAAMHAYIALAKAPSNPQPRT